MVQIPKRDSVTFLEIEVYGAVIGSTTSTVPAIIHIITTQQSWQQKQKGTPLAMRTIHQLMLGLFIGSQFANLLETNAGLPEATLDNPGET